MIARSQAGFIQTTVRFQYLGSAHGGRWPDVNSAHMVDVYGKSVYWREFDVDDDTMRRRCDDIDNEC